MAATRPHILYLIGNELADAADTINEAHADGATPDDAAWDRLGRALAAWWKATGN